METDYVTISAREMGMPPVKEEDLPALIAKLTKEMKEAAQNMKIEHAAELRDEIKGLHRILIEMG